MKRATLALIVRDGKVLLGDKKKGEIGTGTLNGPGGKLDPGETLIECLIREVFEELGITLNPARIVLVAVIQFFAAGELDFEVYVYRTDTFEGELHETDDMIPNWYDIDDLPFDRMLESDREWFPKALQMPEGKTFKARVYYRERAKDFEKIEFEDLP